MKKAIAFTTALLMFSGALLFFGGANSQTVNGGTQATPMVSAAYHGSVLIAPNGSVISNGSDAPISHSAGSNTYTFTGNINGTMIIERSSAVIDGAGFSIYNSTSSGGLSVLNITNSSGVSVKDLTVNASGTFSAPVFGIELYNTSSVTLNSLTISAFGAGVFISNHTSQINMSNTDITPSTSAGFLLAAVFSGFYLNPHGGYPQPENTTSRIILNGDTIVTNDSGPALVSLSNSTVLENSVIVASNVLSFPSAVIMGGNDSSVIHDAFSLNNVSAVNMSYPFGGPINGLQITGNSIVAKLGQDVITPMIYANGNSTISKNTLNINAAGISKVIGIATNGYMATVSDNYVNMTNGTSSSDLYFISPNSTIDRVTGNHLSGDSSSFFNGITTLDGNEPYYLNDSIISNNTMSFNTQIGGFGIFMNAFYGLNNAVFTDNTIHFFNLLWTGSDSGSGASFGIIAYGSNETFTGNNITLSGGAENSGISLTLVGATTGYGENVTVSHNRLNISDQQYAFGMELSNAYGNTNSHNINIQYNQIELQAPVSYTGISLNNLNYSYVNGNTVSSPSVTSGASYLIVANPSNNVTIATNTLYGPDSGKGNTAAIQLEDSSYFLIGNNTIFNTPYGTSLSHSNNVTIEGNYYTNTSQDAIGFYAADNVTVYHNDFVNYTTISAVGIKNVRFNLSYPIGGNYWSNLQGSFVDQKSGPNQNIAGPDGINDSKYSPVSGITDYYPLVSKWTRPSVTFNAPAGIGGTTWNITFDGHTVETTNASVSFNILNGTYQNYSYVYQNNTLYYTNTSMGSVSYSGSSVSVNVPYLHYSYIVGSLNLSNFTVYVNGKQLTVDNGKFNLTVTAGSYDVKIVATGYADFNHTYNLTPGETLDISPNLSKAQTASPPNLLEYVIAGVAAAAVLAGVGLYLRGRRKN